MRWVIAQGTFNILHPGHIYYPLDATSLGDEPHVIIARSGNVTHKPKSIFDDCQRRDMAAASGVVDKVHPGHVGDIFVPIEEIDPGVIVLGHDRHHDRDGIRAVLDVHGIDYGVMHATPRELRHDDGLLPTGRIVDYIVE